MTPDQLREWARTLDGVRGEFVMSVRAKDEYAALARSHAAALEEIERLKKENDTLRGLLGNSAKPCPYCGLPAEDQAKCPSGFPGCARADDQMLSKHFADAYRAEQAERGAERLKVERDEAIRLHGKTLERQHYWKQRAKSIEPKLEKAERRAERLNGALSKIADYIEPHWKGAGLALDGAWLLEEIAKRGDALEQAERRAERLKGHAEAMAKDWRMSYFVEAPSETVAAYRADMGE